MLGGIVAGRRVLSLYVPHCVCLGEGVPAVRTGSWQQAASTAASDLQDSSPREVGECDRVPLPVEDEQAAPPAVYIRATAC
eukprot:scaffold18871_cov69-Phaeocystis_antarctica.AAC.2